MARMLGRWLTGGCRCRPGDNRSWGPDCAGHDSDPRRFKRAEAREAAREIAEAAAERTGAVPRVEIDLTYSGFEDVYNAAAADLPRGTAVEVFERESGVHGPAVVAGRDFARELIYLKVDWGELVPADPR